MLPLAHDQRGFSLAELLIVIALLGLMLTGLLAVQMQGQKAYLIGSHRVEAQQNGRVALELMVRELRSAKSVTLIPSATDITFVGGVVAFNLAYFSDYNGATNTGTTTTVPGNVSAVRLQIVTGTEESVASYSDANQRATMEMLVRLRNHV